MNPKRVLIIVLVLFLSIVFTSTFAQERFSFTVVYNNLPSENNLKCDWGFAVWIQMEDEVVLFDTGTKATILQQNMNDLKLDPAKISKIAISHDHYDHTGGLVSILQEVNDNTTVYLPNNYNENIKNEFPNLSFRINNKYTKISIGVWITEVFINENNGIAEQAMVIEKGDKMLVITGCAHPGILYICKSIKNHFLDKQLSLVTGGFHLRGLPAERVSQISKELKVIGVKHVAPSHCTGDKSIAIFRESWGEKFVQLNLGDTYQF